MAFDVEFITNGNFAAWTGDDPDSWNIIGEVGADPEISEVGTGEGHGGTGTGMCNLYTSDGTDVGIWQNITLIVGRKYTVTIKIDTITAQGIIFLDGRRVMFNETYLTPGIKTFTFIATHTDPQIIVRRAHAAALNDVTFDDISIIEKIPLGLYLSRTGQQFSSSPVN